MNNRKIQINEFQIVGIKIRTTNKNNQSQNDLSQLWQRFFNDGIFNKIPDKTDSKIYCVYSDYESDFLGEYTALVGCRVNSSPDLPEDLSEIIIKESSYICFNDKGNVKDKVYELWQHIWISSLKRKYTKDFEVYSNLEDVDNTNIEIFVAVED